MVYKPKKKVNGHKKNDRYTRRRKARDARKRRAASLPVRSNIKRYVAEQLDKTHPDNRYTYSVTTPTTQIQPHYNWGDFTPIYPFGCTFQEKFLRMEIQRLRPVLKTGSTDAFVDLLGPIDEHNYLPNVDVDMEGPEQPRSQPTDIAHRAMKTLSHKNHWKSILGRGIHMKSSSIYGTIFLNPAMIYELRHSDLKLHMFVLEDKKVTKDAFLAWWTDALDRVRDGSSMTPAVPNQTGRTAKSEDARTNDFKSDHLNVPYRSGSSYLHTTAHKVACVDDIDDKGGEDEVLVDWRKFYEETSDNPVHSLFFNEVKCGHKWDGSPDAVNLPFNRSRFVVHEHKTWSFKPNSAGVVKSCIPFEYSFPDHYMTYEKQLLDQPYVYRKANSTDDSNSGIHWSRMCPRKQPFVVFVYTRSNYNRTKIDGADVKLDLSSRSAPALPPAHLENADHASDDLFPAFSDAGVSSKNTSERVGADDVFSIDMNFKCHYENPLANGQVPTINKGRPIIHKRESAPARKPPPKRDAPMDPISRKSRNKPPRGDLKRGAPFFGPGGKKSKTSLKDHFKVRRNAGPSSSKAMSAQREAVIAKGKDIRAAMRRKEQQDHNVTLAEQGLTGAEFNDMAVEALNEVDDAGKDAFDMLMGGMFPFKGHGRFRSGITNVAFRAILNSKVRDYISRKLSAAGLKADYMSIKKAAKAFYRYHQKLENDRVRAWKTTHPEGRHTRLPEYIRY